MNDGGPAFPKQGRVWDNGRENCYEQEQEGMTLRDYFAAKVMQALLQGPDTCLVMGPEKDAVKAAYKIADAMLKEREK